MYPKGLSFVVSTGSAITCENCKKEQETFADKKVILIVILNAFNGPKKKIILIWPGSIRRWIQESRVILVIHETFKNSLIIHKENTIEINVL